MSTQHPKSNAICIDLTLNDDESEKNHDDEVEIVEPVARGIHAATAQAASSNDDDIELLGTSNETRLPHMRQHCPDNKFVQDVVAFNRQRTNLTEAKKRELDEGKIGNASFCDLCYCFVCDKPAKDCMNWNSAFNGASFLSHCHASDAGYDASTWKARRENVKEGGPSVHPFKLKSGRDCRKCVKSIRNSGERCNTMGHKEGN